MVKATRLKAVRERKSFSQVELAQLAQVSRGTITRIERGFDAHPPTVRKIAAALGVEPEQLMAPEP